MAKTKQKEAPADTSNLNSFVIRVENPRNLYSTYVTEFSGLSPDSLHYYMECSRKGLNFWQSLLFEEIRRRDLRIGAVCQTRKLGCANKSWSLAYRADTEVPEATQKETMQFLYKNFEHVNIVQFFMDIIEAQIQGLSVFENTYRVADNKLCLDSITYIPNHLLLFDDIANEYRFLKPEKSDATELRSQGWNIGEDRIDLEELQMEPINPLKIIEAESFDGNAQNSFLNGCVVSLIWAFLFKNYGLKDWSIYVERFASPGVVGKYPTLMKRQDKQLLFEAVRNWGNAFKAALPDGCTLELISDAGKGSTNSLFENYLNYWDKNISIRVLGQSLTTDVGDTGSYAASKTHGEVRQDLVFADMLLITSVMNKLIRRLLDMNNASVAEYPKFSFDENVDIDYKLKQAQIISSLKQSGYTVSEEDIEKEFGYEVEPSPVAGAPEPAPEADDEDSTDKYISNFIEEYWNGIHR